MAQNPNAKYPLQTTLPSAEYPQGAAKDISGAGAGDGYPWEQDQINDLLGFQQGLLASAGISPTGNPDTAVDSQYRDALNALFPRQLGNTTDILTKDLSGVTGLQTSQYSTLGDGGGSAWKYTGLTIAGNAGTSNFSQGFIYDNLGRQYELLRGTINPRQFGAKGDGATDDWTPVQSAVDAQVFRGGGEVYSPAGTYKLSAQVTVGGDKVMFRGDGAGATTWTWAGAAGSFPNSACFYSTGSAAAIPVLSVDVPKNAITLTWGSPHTLVADDLFAVLDPRASSYAAGLATYHAGEMFVAAEIPSTTTVTVDKPAYATTNPLVNFATTSYDATQCTVSKITGRRVSIRDMKMIGVSGTSANRVVFVDYGRDCVFSGLHLSQSGGILLLLQRCHNSTIVSVEMVDNDPGGAVNIGVALYHSQRVYLDRVAGGNSWFALDVASTTSVDAIVNREIHITNCDLTGRDSAQGSVRFLTNCEDITIDSSRLSGIRIGGDRYRISNCEIAGQRATSPAFGEGWAVFISSTTGLDIEFHGCRIYARSTVALALIYLNDGSPVMYRPRTMVVSDTDIDMAGFTGYPVNMSATDTSEFASVRFSDVRFLGSNVAADTIRFTANTNAAWERLDFESCRLYKQATFMYGAGTVQFSGCDIDDSPDNGISVSEPGTNPFTREVIIRDCRVTGSTNAGIIVTDSNTSVMVSGTTSINNNINITKSASRSSFVFNPAGAGTTALTLSANVFGDDQSAATQTFAYSHNNVDTVIDSRTTVLGGSLPIDRSGSTTERIRGQWTSSALDETHNTGAMSLADGDIPNAPTGSDELVIGDGGGNVGMYMDPGPAGNSTWEMGDSVSPNRFRIQAQHGSDRMLFTVAGNTPLSLKSTGAHPFTAGSTLGEISNRWSTLWGDTLHGGRRFADNADAIAAGDITALVGWGATGAVGFLAGKDSSCRVSIDALGAAPALNPTFTYTYANGSTSASPPIIQLTGYSTPYFTWAVKSATTTSCVIAMLGTPIAGNSYTVQINLVWYDGV